MRWDDIYARSGRVWGEGPSELAGVAVRFLRSETHTGPLSILDAGCGYGRDAACLLENLDCTVAGVDAAPNAIRIATEALAERYDSRVSFRCGSLTELSGEAYDVVFLSNVFQVMQKGERQALLRALPGTLKPGGLLFMSTLSVHDPAHYGKGTPVPGDPESFLERTFLHFATCQELVQDFSFLNVLQLYPLEYHETLNASGEHHHHISWILIGRKPGT